MTHSLESQRKHEAQCEEMALRAVRAVDAAVQRGRLPESADMMVPAGFIIRLLKKHITITMDSSTGTAKVEIQHRRKS